MQLRIKLMGGLKANAPDGDSIDLPVGATIDDVLEALAIGGKRVQIVMVNGKPVGDRSSTLADNDLLTMLPPVSGG